MIALGKTSLPSRSKSEVLWLCELLDAECRQVSELWILNVSG